MYPQLIQVKYGLVGRNGVGKSTLLRAISSKQLQLPDFLHIVHVEQEIAGDDRTALEAVLQADLEREWLLKTEEKLLAQDTDQEGAITLNEVGDTHTLNLFCLLPPKGLFPSWPECGVRARF